MFTPSQLKIYAKFVTFDGARLCSRWDPSAGLVRSLQAIWVEHLFQARRRSIVQIMAYKPRKRKIAVVHQWRQRRACVGKLVQWDTSVHDWLEGRGSRLYLIAVIDDASSRVYEPSQAWKA